MRECAAECDRPKEGWALPENDEQRLIHLVKKLDKTEEEKAYMIACVLVLMGKELKKADYERFKKEVSMVNILQYAEEEGMELGLEKGMEKGIAIGEAKGRIDFLWSLILNRFPKVPYIYYEKTKGLTQQHIDSLGDDLFGMKTLSDFERWFEK